jgi:hypothetical protein
MASLVGQQLKDTYDSLLKTSDNDALGGTYKEITDGSGNGSNLYLGTSGSVGIGSAPTSLLQLEQSIVPRITLIKTGVLSWYLGNVLQGSDNNFTIGTDSGGNTNILTLDTSGKVGIGTNPADILHLKQANGANMRFENSTTGRNIRIGEGVGTTDVFSFRGSGVGTDTLSIDFANDRVGIGTILPDSNLHIYDASGGATLKVASNTANAYDSSKIQMLGGNLSTSELIFGDTADSDVGRIIYRHDGNSLAFDVNAGEKMRIDSSGNVGIGSDDPDNKLVVADSNGAGLEIIPQTSNDRTTLLSYDRNASTYQILNLDGSDFRFNISGSEKMRIDSSGNVGINTDNPSQKLHTYASSGAVYNRIQNNLNSIYLGLESGGIAQVSSDSSSLKVMASTYTSFENAGSESMRIDSSGNVGIGTDSPANGVSGLHISVASSTDQLYLERTGSATGRYYLGAAANSFLIVDDAQSAERMRIDASGNVGIGTDSPAYKMQINSSGLSDVVASTSANDNSALFSTFNSNASSGNFMQLRSYGAGTSGTVFGASVAKANMLWSNNDALMAIGTIGNTPLILGTGNSERMRIDSSGNILFGGISALPNGTSVYGSAFRTDTNGRMGLRLATSATGAQTLAEFFNGNGSVGSIQTNALATSYVTSSDYRLKENVVAMTGALDRVDQLNPSRFNFIADADTTVDGFLAHEVADIVPEAITGEKDATEEYEITPAVLDEDGNVVEEAVMGTRPVYQGIDQSKLVPLLVGAIQELKAEIEQLKNQ